MDDIRKTFAKNLREFRKNKGIGQQTLAKELGISDASVSYWETCKTEPTMSSLVKLADYFEISIDVLVGRKEY